MTETASISSMSPFAAMYATSEQLEAYRLLVELYKMCAECPACEEANAVIIELDDRFAAMHGEDMRRLTAKVRQLHDTATTGDRQP